MSDTTSTAWRQRARQQAAQKEAAIPGQAPPSPTSLSDVELREPTAKTRKLMGMQSPGQTPVHSRHTSINADIENLPEVKEKKSCCRCM